MGGPPQQPDMPPGGVMMQMLMGRWLAQTISAVAKLGVADHVGDHPTPVADLARAVGANEDALYRALRALAMVGVVAEAAPRAFVLTPIGKTLRSDAHDSLRDVAIFFGHETHNRAWTALDHAIKTNKPALEHVTGKKGFELLTGDPEMAGIFNRAMTSFSRQEIGAILHHYDFSGIGKITDVGGGHGLFLGSILQRHAAMKGALFDLPVVVEGAHAHLGALGVADRVEVVGGDFFETAPPKSDAIVMKHIIHDWDDQASVKILGTCRRALDKGGKMLLAEMLLPDNHHPHPAKLLDLEMLVMAPGGRERSEEEYGKLYAQSGFELSRVVRTPAPICIIEGVAV